MASQTHALGPLEFMGNRWLYFKFLNKAICQIYGKYNMTKQNVIFINSSDDSFCPNIQTLQHVIDYLDDWTCYQTVIFLFQLCAIKVTNNKRSCPYLLRADSSCSESIFARRISPETLPKNSSNFCSPRTSFLRRASHKSRSWSLVRDLGKKLTGYSKWLQVLFCLNSSV